MNKMIIYLGVLYSFSFFLLYVSNIKGIQNYLIGIYLLLFIIIALGSSLFLNINKKMFFEIFIVIILLIFFHSVNGFLGGMLILLTIFIISNFNEINIKNKKILVFVISLFSAASIMLWYKGILYYPDASIFNVISSNTYLFGPDKTLDLFLGIYPKILILLFLISYIIIFKEKKDIILFSYGITAVLLFLFFFPISTSYRFLMYAHPFFIILVAYAIYRIFSTIKIKPVKILFLFCIILFSLINLYDKNLNTLQNPTISNLQDNFEIFEIGKFLKNNSEDNSIVICSEWYQTYSSNYGLTDRIFLWENGNFREDLVRDIYLSSSSEQAYASILNLIKNKNYIVGYVDNKEEEVRRFYKYPSEVYILYDDILARYLGDSNSIEKFFDTTYFELVYTKKNLNGNNFYVFKLKI
ncbi:MAG: hypothetical protein KO464_03295 [Candidatus Methanofastidiosum sp.]|nr:hypothetical protein [Methanofastidiosum sp.]